MSGGAGKFVLSSIIGFPAVVFLLRTTSGVRDKPDYHVENGRSVDRARRGLVRELSDGRHDPAPGRGAIVIADGCELVGASGAFLERALTVPLEHQLRRPPDVDLGYQRA